LLLLIAHRSSSSVCSFDYCLLKMMFLMLVFLVRPSVLRDFQKRHISKLSFRSYATKLYAHYCMQCSCNTFVPELCEHCVQCSCNTFVPELCERCMRARTILLYAHCMKP